MAGGLQRIRLARRARYRRSSHKTKVGLVMREFSKGKLRSSSGAKVTNQAQAFAIALSESGLSKKK